MDGRCEDHWREPRLHAPVQVRSPRHPYTSNVAYDDRVFISGPAGDSDNGEMSAERGTDAHAPNEGEGFEIRVRV
jgi:hypothetical protein